MRKLGIFTWFGYRTPIPERLRLIRKAGFETALHWWGDEFAEAEGYGKEATADLIRQAGLSIESAHLPISSGSPECYLDAVDGLAARGIPVAVLHTESNRVALPGFSSDDPRFHALIRRAEARGIRIALENVRDNAALCRLLDAIDSPALGFCYDSGHDFAWSERPYELLHRYGHRLFAVHLHDNFGQDDDHLAPGEGKVDWPTVLNGIEQSAYTGPYTLESDSVAIPPSRTARQHLALHYESARRTFSRWLP